MIDKLKTFLIQNLRRISYRWPERGSALRKARISRGLYLCNHCKGQFKSKEINVDHVIPIIDPVMGWVNIEIYIERMFCNEDGFQVLCKNCHDVKSEAENSVRRDVRKNVLK